MGKGRGARGEWNGRGVWFELEFWNEIKISNFEIQKSKFWIRNFKIQILDSILGPRLFQKMGPAPSRKVAPTLAK